MFIKVRCKRTDCVHNYPFYADCNSPKPIDVDESGCLTYEVTTKDDH